MTARIPASPQIEELMSHSAWLRNLARSLVRDTAAADDLVQETWLAALRNPPDPTRPAKPWLAGVMRRLVAMRARGEARRARRQRSAARSEDLPSTAELVEGVDTQQRIAQAVLALSEPYRTTVLLRYYQQMSSAEIARRQGIPSATVRWRLRRGLSELRERLDQLWPDRRSWCLALLALEWPGMTLANGAGEAGGVGVATGAGSVGGAALLGLPLSALVPWSALAALTAVAGWFGLTRWQATSPVEPLEVAARPGVTAPGEPRATALRAPHGAAPRTRALGPSVPAARSTNGVSGAGGAEPGEARGRHVRVLYADGSPAAHVHALAVAEDGQLAHGDTDAAGRLDVGGIPAPTVLYVKRPESFLQRIPLGPPDAEAAESGSEPARGAVFLAEGRELSGRVSIDGSAPAPPLSLTLTRDHPLFGDEDAPEPVRARFRSARIAHARTAPDGSFRFEGLASDWSGTLRLPKGYRYVEEGEASRGDRVNAEEARQRVLAFSAPTPGLELAVVSERTLTGRVFDRRGQPGDADVVATLTGAGKRPKVLNLTTGPDGEFAAPVPGEFTHATLRARSPRGALGAATVALVEEAQVDLRLAPARTVEIHVEGPEGAPVAGASVSATDASLGIAWAAHVRAPGVFALDVPVERELELRIDARGHFPSASALGSSDRVRVTLEPCATVSVRALGEGGSPYPAARIRVDGMVTERAHEVRPLDARAAGRGPGFACDRAGQLALDGFLGSEELVFTWLDALGNPMASVPLRLNGPRVHELELALPHEVPRFAGSVQDESGRPIVGAALLVTRGADDGTGSTAGDAEATWRLRTDREGRFDVPHGERGKVSLTVSKDGYEAVRLQGVELASLRARDFTLCSAAN